MKRSQAKRLALVKARRYRRGSNGGTSGMERRFVKIEKGLGPQGRIAVVRFDRGDNINALSHQAMRELCDVPRDFADDLDTSVVILTGSAKAFSAGFDLKDPQGRQRDQLSIGERIHRQRLGPRMCKAWEEMDQITIAAIEGHCIGGGAALVVALDFRTCGRSAHFRIPEVELGMNMSWGSIPRLVALMGPARTKQVVILASDRIGSGEALEWGLVEKVVENGQALAAAMQFAERIALQPPLPVRMVKTSVNRVTHALADVAAHMDVDQNVLTSLTEDYREGTSAFREKRKPAFKGR
jgi:enoyl-CoA hydratase